MLQIWLMMFFCFLNVVNVCETSHVLQSHSEMTAGFEAYFISDSLTKIFLDASSQSASLCDCNNIEYTTNEEHASYKKNPLFPK